MIPLTCACGSSIYPHLLLSACFLNLLPSSRSVERKDLLNILPMEEGGVRTEVPAATGGGAAAVSTLKDIENCVQ